MELFPHVRSTLNFLILLFEKIVLGHSKIIRSGVLKFNPILAGVRFSLFLWHKLPTIPDITMTMKNSLFHLIALAFFERSLWFCCWRQRARDRFTACCQAHYGCLPHSRHSLHGCSISAGETVWFEQDHA